MKLTRLLVVLAFAIAAIALSGCGDVVVDSGPEEGVRRVTVAWSEDVDLDLEIWNEDGTEQLETAYNLIGWDETTWGDEHFDFKDYGDGDDYSTGTYVISVYFADYGDDEDAGPHLTWLDEDGDEQELVTSLEYEDQWHAIQIDAESGEYVVLDQVVETVTQ